MPCQLAAVGVFGAYALGMALVLMALSIGAGLLRDGLARALGRAIPHLRWINGGLLLLVSAYNTTRTEGRIFRCGRWSL